MNDTTTNEGRRSHLRQVVADRYRDRLNDRGRTAEIATNTQINNNKIDLVVALRNHDHPCMSNRYVVECRDCERGEDRIKSKDVWRTISISQHVGAMPVIVTETGYTGAAGRVAQKFGVNLIGWRWGNDNRIKNQPFFPVFDSPMAAHQVPDLFENQREWIKDQLNPHDPSRKKFDNNVLLASLTD